MGEHNKLSSDFNGKNLRVRFVILPRELYDSYLEFYRLARDVSIKAEQTIMCGTHQYAMFNGRKHFENMPNETMFLDLIYEFQDRIREHKTHIYNATKREFDCGRDPHDYVYITHKQAQEYYALVEDANMIFNDTIQGVWKTDYLKNMTHLKDHGRPYDGKTCLQELFNMAVSIIQIQQLTDELVKDGLVIPEWKNFVKAP
jgi:hypothetical protein